MQETPELLSLIDHGGCILLPRLHGWLVLTTPQITELWVCLHNLYRDLMRLLCYEVHVGHLSTIYQNYVYFQLAYESF